MSLAYKILGQKLISYTTVPTNAPSSGYGYYGNTIGNQGIINQEQFLPVTVYTVPAGKQAVTSSIFISNLSDIALTYDLAIVPSGEQLSLKHHIRWDMTIAAKDFELITSKITLGPGDSIVVFPSTVNSVSVNILGVEK